MSLRNNQLFPKNHTQDNLLKAQKIVASKVILKDTFDIKNIATIAGVDQAFFKDQIISGIVVLDYFTLKIIARAYSIKTIEYPYIPTFLSFREGPAIISAFKKLTIKPDILMIDACGINHPRMAGLATHIGVALNIPTIGVAKNILCGTAENPEKVGEYNPLMYNNKKIGFLLKSKQGCNPIIVAPGHGVSLDSSIKIIMHCLRGYKLPEPTRHAHIYVNSIKTDVLTTLMTL